MKAIKVACMCDKHGSVTDRHGPPIFIVKETNKYFNWYKNAVGWKVLKEFEVEK